MNFVETEPGLYSVIVDGVVYEVRASEVRAGLQEICVNGVPFEIAAEDPRKWMRPGGAAGAQGRILIIAPMPGRIVRVLVGEGDAVMAGQGIMVMEAMKMQNEMKAPRPGRVTALHARENDSVNAGALLALIE